ncbi:MULTISPECIES: PPOX class F420-dependent oxidoreductase [Dactylosporangium]|uniref:PPOX class F420-dependent oxidoreductase n=2 Tax=Dactylosporangium TaxID=35753 RepID=A0A9W6KQZ6_9ACTN|nr:MULTISPECIES: PPOX class F420-dependent oxidoreductase [Dactylosporangium]UAB96398.1 PPOX class F420-dependent oxidoreductase [Dactylosporangium vinaceum]UWZ44729.1 PPOX class F420-dependent oxidoreductase [Dactylosporangium matsuzakiense]GLL05978.1 PPOX class F420-dependent oxidoreductase [Dactylosporangium matsuzakiense]
MTNTPATVERLSEEQYLLVTTFRRDGTPVPTPVWAARDGEALVVWTVGASGKVKRIRNNGRVTVAPCTVRGKPTGEEHPAHAEVLDPAGGRRVRDLIKRKYGLQGRLFVWASIIRRGQDATVGVRITLD